MNKPYVLIVAIACAIAGPSAFAQARAKIDAVPHVAADTESFLRFHQDLRWRQAGVESFDRGRYNEALTQLQRAAKFGDKPAQALVAEMYWLGQGVTQDRARAYAWMDLAAERNYKSLVSLREYYWSQLSERERDDALRIGQDVYASYGDRVAIPRMDRLLRAGRREITGSRVGFLGNLEVELRSKEGGWIQVSGEKYYRAQYWKPELYHQWKDEFFENPYNGEVDIGEIRKARLAEQSR